MMEASVNFQSSPQEPEPHNGFFGGLADSFDFQWEWSDGERTPGLGEQGAGRIHVTAWLTERLQLSPGSRCR